MPGHRHVGEISYIDPRTGKQNRNKFYYGNSDYDLRHHFSLSITYNIPGKKSPAQLLEGWTVNSAVVLQSGLPWTATDGSDDVSQTGVVKAIAGVQRDSNDKPITPVRYS